MEYCHIDKPWALAAIDKSYSPTVQENMGTSYVEFIDRGYWTHDAFLEGLSYILAREFNKLKNKQDWQTELIDKWNVAATVGFAVVFLHILAILIPTTKCNYCGKR